METTSDETGAKKTTTEGTENADTDYSWEDVPEDLRALMQSDIDEDSHMLGNTLGIESDEGAGENTAAFRPPDISLFGAERETWRKDLMAQLHRANAKIAAMRAQHKLDLKECRDECTDKLRAAQEEIVRKERIVEELSIESDAVRSKRVGDLRTQHESALSERDNALDRFSEIQERVIRLESENQRLRESILAIETLPPDEDVSRKLADAEAQLAKKDQSVLHWMNRYESAAKGEGNEIVRRKTREYKSQIEDLKTSVASLERANVECRSTNERLRAEADLARERAENLAQALKSAERESAANVDELRKQVEGAEASLNHETKRRQESDANAADAMRVVATLTKDLEILRRKTAAEEEEKKSTNDANDARRRKNENDSVESSSEAWSKERGEWRRKLRVLQNALRLLGGRSDDRVTASSLRAIPEDGDESSAIARSDGATSSAS
eukprot:g1218.t1